MRTRETSLATLRRALREAFGEKVRVARGHDGAVLLRAISERFDTDRDPLEVVREELARRDVELPDRTLAILKAPADLEPNEEEALLRSSLAAGTPTWADALTLEPEAPPARTDAGPRTVAFWGLKGGVGRTTALAHVAALLGRRSKVLAVDLDLDSPGLVGTLAAKVPSDDSTRFEALLRVAGDQGSSMAMLTERVKQALRPGRESHTRVQVLGPERADADYVTDLAGPVTPSALYRGHEPALHRFLEAAAHAAEADIVLIDARSGYSDEAAMAVLDVADEVVVFASPSPSTFSSLEPAIEALERCRLARGKPRLIHFAAGMLPGNDEVRDRIVAELARTADGVFARVSDLLETPTDQRPAHVVPVRVDYMPRIVENDGALVQDAGEGYRELAGRIEPSTPWIPGLPLEPGWPRHVVDQVCAFFDAHPLGAPEVRWSPPVNAWRSLDVHRLVLLTLCVASPDFAALAARFGVTIDALREGAPERLEDTLALVWGERLDSSEGRIRTTEWLAGYLTEPIPDEVLAFVRRAFEAQKARGAREVPPLLDAASLRAALPQVDVFISYAAEDEALARELEAHLSGLTRERVVRTWRRGEIPAGDDWRSAIDEQLALAGVILVLVSADYLACDVLYEGELTRALERQGRGEARVVPVIVRACDWETSALGRFEALPRTGGPVMSWPSRDAAWLEVVRGIREALGSGRPTPNN